MSVRIDNQPPSRSTNATLAEIGAVCAIALVVIGVGWRLVGDNNLARQAVIWVAYLCLIGAIWVALRLRGQTWRHLGLAPRIGGWRGAGRTVLQSIGVLVVALAAFVAGAAVMGVTGPDPQSADMSGYNYLQGNLPMLLLALAAVYVASSFGEEVVFRGFLMHRLAELGGGGKAAWGGAIVVSGVLFGLAHYAWGVAGVVQTTFMGFALGVCFLLTGRNLWPLVLAHVYLDTALLVPLYRASAG